MRRIIPALSLLLFLFAIACATATQPHPQSQKQDLVSVYLESRPDRAELYIDGKLVGSTDMTYRLPPGTHTIEVRKEGYETWRRELTVTNGVATKLSAMLVKI